MSSRRALLESLLLSRLPSAFQEVEYLESSGTQYIDSGVVPNTNTQIVAKCNFLGTNDAKLFVCGTFLRNLFQLQRLNDISSNLNHIRAYYFSSSNYGDFTSSVVATNPANIDFNKNVLNINNGEITNTFTNTTSQPNDNLRIFNVQTNNDIQLYYFKIYDNNILIRDFVPCYRKADNVAGLYDLANGIFYTNAGTGTFIVGGNV